MFNQGRLFTFAKRLLGNIRHKLCGFADLRFVVTTNFVQTQLAVAAAVTEQFPHLLTLDIVILLAKAEFAFARQTGNQQLHFFFWPSIRTTGKVVQNIA